MSEHERKEQINCFCKMGLVYAVLAVTFCVGGVGLIVCVQNKGYEFEGFTDQIFIGSFMLMAVSFLYAVSAGRIPALEKESKKQEIYDCVKCQGLLLLAAIIGLAFACTLTGVFVSNSNIFEICNITDSSFNSRNTSDTDICVGDCKAFVIVQIASLIVFGLLFLTSFFTHDSAQDKVALPVHRPRQATDEERAKQVGDTEGMVFLHLLGIAVFIVIGLIQTSCLYKYEGLSFWDRIYIGAFLIAGICLLHVFLTGGITTAEKEGRRKDVSEKVKSHGCMLIASVIGIGFASAFMGVFLSNHNVFHPCDSSNSTQFNVTSEKDFCFHDCKGSVIANIVFMVLFVLVTIIGCTSHSKKSAKLVTNDTNVEPMANAAKANGNTNNQNKTDSANQKSRTSVSPSTSVVTVKTNVSTLESQTNKSKTKKKTLKLKKHKGSDINSMNRIEETRSKTDISETTVDSLDDVPMYYTPFVYTNESTDIVEDDLYRNQHISETPPPLVFVVDKESTMLARRLPPIPRYKSFAATPSVDPPRYEDVVQDRTGDKK